MGTQSPQVRREARPARLSWPFWAALLLVAGVVVAGELFWLKSTRQSRQETRQLPVLAQVPDFSLTKETGATLTKKDLLGKVWVADFIFTRCTGPCPVMTDRMRQLQTATHSMAGGSVQLVSVTVDPAHDTPKVLSEYGGRIGSNPDRWSFLTGDPDKVIEFISKGMLLGVSQDGAGLPVHSQKFAVVDREGYIRSYHDLEDAALVPQIITDVETLSREPRTPKDQTK